jgi:hypothetical protein
MGRKLAIGLASGVAGYVAGAVAGGLLITAASSNTHDVSIEAAMTGAFVTGPLAGILAAVIGFIRTRPARPTQ